MSTQARLKPAHMIMYGTALFGFNLMMQMNTMYFAFFLTDMALIPAALMGTIVMICRIGDMISVPIVSGLMEKINMRWGKFRSWLLVGGPILAVFFTLIFINPNISSTTAKIGYYVTVYLIAHVFVNFTYAALYGLVPVMGKHPEDRTLLSARRNQFYSAAGVGFGLIAMPIILFFSGGPKPAQHGFTLTVALFALVMAITYLLAFKASKDYDLPAAQDPNAAKQPGLTGGEMVSQTVQNPPFLAMIVGDICRCIALFGVAGVAAYYFRYVANDMKTISIFFTTAGLIQFGTAMIFPFLAKVIDKRNLYIAGHVIILVSQFSAWLFAHNSMSFIVLVGLSYMGISICSSASPAMFADSCDYGEWKTGKSARGFIMSMANMPPKIALITTGSFTGFALAAMGYVANKPASPELVEGIRNLIHLLPAGAALVGIIVVALFNKMTVAKTQEMQREVQYREKLAA